MRKGKQKPSPSIAQPTLKPIPRVLRGIALDGEGEHRPLWRLSLLDAEYVGQWHWQIDRTTTTRIVRFLTEMERLTWREIWDQQAGGERRRGAKHKLIPVDHLCKEAQQRIREIRLDDWEELFRFRLSGPERLWGILTDETPRVFYPVWWDPDHKICPNKDK